MTLLRNSFHINLIVGKTTFFFFVVAVVFVLGHFTRTRLQSALDDPAHMTWVFFYKCHCVLHTITAASHGRPFFVVDI